MAYVKNTWVDREGQTRYHETIDDDGALIFTPDYEKVTEIGTPVNADNMNHIEEGIEDHETRITVLENAGSEGYVNKSGDTMTGNLTISKSGTSDITLQNKNIDYTTTTTPSSYTRVGATFMRDKNNKVTGAVENFLSGGGDFCTTLYARRSVDGTEKTCKINAGVTSSGEVYATAPTPATGDSSTKIATTEWVNHKCDSQITNCLLEVPQRINLTLSDGTLTLKKGSVVTVPYGTTNRTSEFPVGSQFLNSNWKVVDTQFADNKFFVWAELQKDMSNQRTEAPDGKDRYISIYLEGSINGATGSQSGTSFSNGLGYNTSENTVYWYNTSGVAQGTQLALPIGIVACSDTYTFGSIKQVFNGMGYVGRTLWLDKGVKLLAGTGRNADGTIKNTEITTKLLIKASHTYTEDRLLLYKKSGALEDLRPDRYLIGLKKDMPTTVSGTSLHNYFCTDTLETYWTSGSTTTNWQQAENKTPIAVYGAIKEDDGETITFLNPYQTFRAVDYNDKREITTWGFPSSKYTDLTWGATDSTYTAPANGWYYACKNSGYADRAVSLQNLSNGMWSRTFSASGNNHLTAIVPVKKGDIVKLTYNATGENVAFRFIYAEGDK